MSASGSQMSARPPAKPNGSNPMSSSATFPAKIIRSPHESALPYFAFTGHSSRRALSRLTLSGHELSGAKRWLPVLPPPRPSKMRYVPAACHAIRMKNGP